MRQFVFGLLVAALAWWGWSAHAASRAAAAGDPGSGGAVRLDLAQVNPERADVAPRPLLAGSRGPEEVAIQEAFDRLATQIEQGEAGARERGLAVLARSDLWPEHRERLQELLGRQGSPAPSAAGTTPGAEGIEGALQRLGTNNRFLHTAEGRRYAAQALQLAAALPDEEALAALTRILELSMRGPIAIGDTAAREIVDSGYRALRPRADRVLCDPANLTRARSHTLASGESLAVVAARFRREGIAIDEHSLAILNRIHNPNAVQAGQRIRVPTDPIHAVVEKRSFLMAVYVGASMLRLYWIGHGADGKTPVAEFAVAEKLKDPEWYAPDGGVYAPGHPKNILGKYFLKFTHPSYTGFGAHGTPMPETIGTMSSMGCIRMYDQDIEELFRLLPRKAKVVVRDSQ